MRVSSALIKILSDPSSLTKRFKALAKKSFAVEVKQEGWGLANQHICQKLGIAAQECVWQRQVRIKVDGEVFLHACSYIPQKTLSFQGRQLLFLKTKPLGETLFRDIYLKRSKFEWCPKLKIGNQYQAITRSSIFIFHGQPLLVAETFTVAALKAFDTTQKV